MASYKEKGIQLEEDDDEAINLPDQEDEQLIKEYTIGDRLGKVDKIDAPEGKIKVDIDSSKPLKFTRKLQTRTKQNTTIDITIKLHYEKLFKHCSTCGLMTHEAQDCSKNQSILPGLPVTRDNVFDRMRPRGDLKETSAVPRNNGPVRSSAAPYKSLKESNGAYSRVQRSSYSSRPEQKDSRYNPYSYVRHDKRNEPIKGREWKEKHNQPIKIKDQSTSDTGTGNSSGSRPRSLVTKVLVEKTQPADANVTFRTGVDSGASASAQKDITEDLIPPYNALKIDALTDFDQEDEAEADVDAYMEEALGNELMVMEEDDLLGEELENAQSPAVSASGE
ncbi:Uncharacterized protein Rs2_21506 [Raphanus sativus]|nr:Uncharacterized protein Rs2_21506 [Raphanus sativus]